ncbi:MAG: cation diffusion facilitator family transporter [Dehalococcoidia bacterium]
MASESKSAVLAAMGANAAIAVGKLVGGSLTGSASMFAEAGHSIADTVNQVFLLAGLNLSDNRANEEHPHGYGKEQFFWSFLAAIFIFVAGAAFSLYEGTRTLLHDETHHRETFEVAVAFGVLGAAFIFECFSMLIAVRAIKAGARRKGWGFVRFLRESPDATTKTVFFEDGAALNGLVFAALGLGLSEITGNEAWDGIASVSIGVILAIVAVILGMQARRLLLGAAASPEVRAHLAETIAAFPEIERTVRVLTMQLGAHSVLVTGELQVRSDMTVDAIEALIVRLDEAVAARLPEVVDTFWELKRVRA